MEMICKNVFCDERPALHMAACVLSFWKTKENKSEPLLLNHTKGQGQGSFQKYLFAILLFPDKVGVYI